MGYRTVMKVPGCRTYSQAMTIFDESKPIRGRSPELRPLGSRRDCDSYSVRMHNDAVQFVLYKTPVITFTKGEDGATNIQIITGGYDSVSTRMFIERVLSVSCYSRNRHTLIEFGDEKHLLGDEIKLRFADGKLSLAGAPTTRYGYRLNRKAANNVRAKYRAFDNYLKGFIALRMGQVKTHSGYIDVVEYTAAEAIELLGTRQKFNTIWVNTDQFESLNLRPYEQFAFTHTGYGDAKRFEAIAEYRSACEMFFGWIGSDDHHQFYKAAMALVTFDSSLTVEDQRTIRREAARIPKLYDSILMRWHAEEVLEKIQLENGRIPNPQYANWICEDEKYSLKEKEA